MINDIPAVLYRLKYMNVVPQQSVSRLESTEEVVQKKERSCSDSRDNFE